jgi:hypothetical protein
VRVELLGYVLRRPRLAISLPKLPLALGPLALALILAFVASTIAVLHVWEGGWMPKELS